MVDAMASVYFAFQILNHVIGYTGALCLLLLLGVVSYRLLLHPLARIPGPVLAGISSAWLAYHVRNGRSVLIGRDLHQKYGPMVRVGPNEVWFNTKESFRAIYRESLQ
jgi:hypothetical protein